MTNPFLADTPYEVASSLSTGDRARISFHSRGFGLPPGDHHFIIVGEVMGRRGSSILVKEDKGNVETPVPIYWIDECELIDNAART